MSEEAVPLSGMELYARANVPPGLEYLVELDQVIIQQIIEVCEALAGCEFKNKYLLSNNMGQQFMFAKEYSSFCARFCCGNMRAFEMGFYDNNELEVLRMNRPLSCAGCCTPCCLQSLEVTNQGMLLGSVHQEWSFCTPWAGKYSVMNASGDVVFRVKAPCCICSCGRDIVFPVYTDDWKVEVGQIRKTWRGCCAECFTDADNFSITFDKNMDVRMKALFLGAAFLIDFIYFERQQQ